MHFSNFLVWYAVLKYQAFRHLYSICTMYKKSIVLDERKRFSIFSSSFLHDTCNLFTKKLLCVISFAHSNSGNRVLHLYGMCIEHRYLMTRLSLQVVYLWRHVSSTAPPFILWWSNLEIIFGPLHPTSPFIGELRCQAIQMEHGPYI
jgi:hypothetical protein